MVRSIIATVVLALIAVRVAAGEEDLATQIKALQKERAETLTTLVKDYTQQYKLGAVSGEVFAGAETALVNAQLEAADKPAAAADILMAALDREVAAQKVAADRAVAAHRDHETDVYLWSSVCSQTSIRLSRVLKEKNEAKIKGEREQRIRELTTLVENYKERYKAGTAPLEALVRAQVALLDARTDAAEKHKKRIALLEEGVKSEAELLKAAESMCNASVCSARSLFLDAKVRRLRERGAKDDAAAQIKAAQKERVEALTEVVKIDTELYETGWTELVTLIQAKADLANAQVDAADTSEAKVLVLAKAVKAQTEFVRVTEARAQAGLDANADVDRERSRLLDFKIRLLRERGPQKARNQ